MQHHRHPGLAGRLASDGASLDPHPDCSREDARIAWFPVASADGRDVDALEALLCVPTRAGAMRLAAVPHVVEGLALGDEVAVGDWRGEPLARGELALALAGTVRLVVAGGRGWAWAARLLDDAAGDRGSCWFDLIGQHALAATVPRTSLGAVFEAVGDAADAGELRWEYVTAARHAEQVGGHPTSNT